MSALSNYHTHSTFCDGKDTPEELVLEAIRLGCPELGFSGHAHVSFDDHCMTPEGTELYKREILRLKEKYCERITVRLGVEQDFYSDLPTEYYEYVIGSVHYLPKDGQWLSVDESPAGFDRAVREHYAGDIYALCEDYYAHVARVYEKTRCTIVGHFDLVTKYNEGGQRFDTAHPRYRAAALAALDRLCTAPVLFEINTGAIARGYRTGAYPEPWILEELARRKAGLILSSDCHDKRFLLCELERYRALPGVRERLFA